MGSDYRYKKIFVGRRRRKEKQQQIVQVIEKELTGKSFVKTDSEKTSNWSYFLIESNEKWIHLGELGPFGTFHDLSIAISNLFPVIEINVSDTAAVHFYLFKSGKMVDKYGSMAFPFFPFEDEELAKEHFGVIEKWKEFLVSEKEVADLRETWHLPSSKEVRRKHRTDFSKLMKQTHALFGWDISLGEIGYTHDLDGMAARGLDYLKFGVGEAYFVNYKIIEKHYRYTRDSPGYQTIFDLLDYK